MPQPYGYWTLDELGANESTTFADAGTGGNIGTLVTGEGSTGKSVTGKYNSALTFDGTNDVLSIANQANFNVSPFTVTLWCKDLATIGSAGILASKGGAVDGWNWEIYDNDLYVTHKGAGGADAFYYIANYGITDSNWHHLGVVHTFDTVTAGNNAAVVYLDGVLRSGTPTSMSLPAATARTLKFGCRDNAGSLSNFLSGQLDDLRFYNVALTAADIAALVRLGIASPPTYTFPRLPMRQAVSPFLGS